MYIGIVVNSIEKNNMPFSSFKINTFSEKEYVQTYSCVK